MGIKARYEKKSLKLLEDVDLEEGEFVEVEIKRDVGVEKLVGLLKDMDMDSVSLQHKIKDIWVKKSVSD